jgi:hypothetical protein
MRSGLSRLIALPSATASLFRSGLALLRRGEHLCEVVACGFAARRDGVEIGSRGAFP